MKSRNGLFVMSLMLVLLLGSFTLPLVAQHKEAQHQDKDLVLVGKKGEVSFTSKVRVGDVVLERGTYQIQHIVEGEDHVIVFKKMVSPGGPGYGSKPGNEVTRVKCKLEPLGETAKHTGLRYGTNAAGEKTIEEVHVKGENVKHVF